MVRPSRLTATETAEFRKELAVLNTKLNIIKNSVMRKALAESDLPEMDSLHFGEHAVIFLGDDIVTPSKNLKKFIESSKDKAGKVKIEIAAGILGKELLTQEQAIELAEMPDKKASISSILGIIENSIQSIQNVVEDPIRSYLSIIEQKFKQD